MLRARPTGSAVKIVMASPLVSARPTGGTLACAILMSTLASSCTEEAEPRTQLLVILDTDLPTVLQAAEREDLSVDASIDAVRIDVYSPEREPIQSLVVIAPSREDWPVSFGVPAIDGVGSVLVHARVFRADRARQGTGPEQGLLVPQPALTVSRVLSLSFPEQGVGVARATLAGDCLGLPPSFEDPVSSCIDASRASAPAAEGVDTSEAARELPTLAGTWPLALERKCSGEPPPGATCIAGGFTALGEEGLSGAADGYLLAHDPVPLRPVRVSAFFADETEYTVKRLREALARSPGLLAPGEVLVRDPNNDLQRDCTFLGESDAAHDDLPLNCITFSGARKLCQDAGGDLMSEAQWEHAARGRGQGRPFAWGSTLPDCCHGNYFGCAEGPLAAGAESACGGGDVSRDGLADLTGNLNEIVLDSHVSYDGPCWASPGLLHDPVCDDPSVATKTWRGSSYTEPVALAHLALRRQGFVEAALRAIGVRCAYPDDAP